MESSAKIVLYFLGVLAMVGYFIRRKRHKQQRFKDPIEPPITEEETSGLPPSLAEKDPWDLTAERDGPPVSQPLSNEKPHETVKGGAKSIKASPEAVTLYDNSRESIFKKQGTVDQSKHTILVMFLMAKPGRRFAGYELLQALIATGLRFGKMDIFHRHEGSSGAGPVLFSVASATQPGTFDMSRMGSFACPGLTLFMDVKSSAIPRIAFASLLEAAYQLAEDLDGELLDDQHQPWTHAYEAHCWEIVNHCEQEQMALDLPVE